MDAHRSRPTTDRARLVLATVAAAALLVVPVLAGAACAPAPLDGCRHSTVPGKSRLILRSGVRPDKQTLVWKLFRGEATQTAYYGSPTTTDEYDFCIYGADDTVVYEAAIPPGGQCGARKCWNAIGDRGFRYRDGQGRNDGITKVRLYRGDEGRTRVIVKGRGVNLPPADMPFGLPTLVQLQAANGHCWEASFSNGGVTRNSETRFGGRSDP
jgi:hypothetical protein